MHKKIDTTTALRVACCILFCTGVFGTFFKKDGKNFTEVKTALLNPADTEKVNRIEITNPQGALLLHKNAAGFWSGELYFDENPLTFPVERGHIESLINASGRIRKMYKISDAPMETIVSSSLPDTDDGIFILEFAQDTQVFSRFYVKSAHTAAHVLHIGTEGKNAAVYTADGDLLPFLNINPALWADGKLFSDYVKQGKTESDVQKLVYVRYNDARHIHSQKIIAAGDTDFDSALHELFSARTAKIADEDTERQYDSLYRISAEFFDGTASHIFIYKDGDDFTVVPCAAFAIETVLQEQNFNYALKISAWTAENAGIGRIIEAD